MAQHALGDRDRVGGVALARPLVHPLSLDAPGRDVQDLVTGGDEHGTEETAVAAGVLNPDCDAVRALLLKPAAQPSDAGTAVDDRERGDGSAALVDDRGGVASLVDVTPTIMLSPYRSKDSIGSGSVRDATVLVDWPTLL